MRHLRWFLVLVSLSLSSLEGHAQIIVSGNSYLGYGGFVPGGLNINARFGRRGYLSVSSGFPGYGGLGGYGYPGLFVGGYYRQTTIVYGPGPLVVAQPVYIPVPVPVGNPLGQDDLLLDQMPLPQAGLRRAPRPDAPARQPAPAPAPAPKPLPAPVPPKPEAPPPPPKPMPMPPQPADPEKDPLDENSRLITLGKQAFTAREYGKAAQRFRQAARVAPELSRTYFLLAQAYVALGKYLDAQESILEGLARRPDWPREPFRPIELYGDHPAEYSEHLRRLREVVEHNERDAVLLFLYGYQLWFDGQRDEARGLFLRALPGLADPEVIQGFLKALPAGSVL